MDLMTFSMLADYAQITVTKPTFFRHVNQGLAPEPIIVKDDGTRLWTPLQAQLIKQFYKDHELIPKLSKKKCKVFSVLLQKGGVGKTNLTINLAATLSYLKNARVLIIDADQQASASLHLGARQIDIDLVMSSKEERHPSLFDVLFARERQGKETKLHPTSVIRTIEYVVKDGNTAQAIQIDILPSNSDLAGADTLLFFEHSRYDRFHELAIKPIEDQYDYILIDCPPNLSLVTMNALRACDFLVIPMMPTFFAFDGLSQLFKTLDVMQSRDGLGHEVALAGVAVLGKQHTSAHDSTTEKIQQLFGKKMFKTIIPWRTVAQEAEMLQTPVITNDFKSDIAQDYISLTKEFLSALNP